MGGKSSLERNRNLIDGKEKDFWGIVNGHSAEKELQIERSQLLPAKAGRLDNACKAD